MNILHLPVADLLPSLAGVLVCLAIVLSCICRINVSERMDRSELLSQLMFIAFAFWAGGTLFDLLRGHVLRPHEAAPGLGILLYLALTYEEWREREHRAQEEAPPRGLRWDTSARNYVPVRAEEDGNAGPKIR